MFISKAHRATTAAALTAALCVGGPAVASASASSTPTHNTAAAKAASVGGLTVHRVAVAASAVPAQVKASLAAAAVPASSTVYEYEFANGANTGLCLDANDAGSTAGANGDKVQLWSCKGTANQFWYGVDISSNYTTLVNAEYQSKCLNAADNGGLADGRHVQLYDCSVGTSNEFWYEPGDYIWLQDSDFVLDATSQAIGSGDQIQIYTYNGGAQQEWFYTAFAS